MSKTRVWMMVGCCVILLAAVAQGQIKQKPGLWEMTISTSMGGAGAPQMPQMPQGAQMPPGMQMPASPFAPHTTQVCVTQAMIDKYGGPYSNPPRGGCRVTDISIKSDGMTAKIMCTGQMNATGTVKSTFVDANTTKTSSHITGAIQVGQNSRPVGMTMESTSIYKGADCGDVKPATMPTGN
jgi:hypothetical protein